MEFFGLTIIPPPALLWVLAAVLIVALLKSPWFKGRLGETRVRVLARFGLPREDYRPVHDVILATPGGTTQIDHIFVSRFGIFVVETKHVKGWIFGRHAQRRWTQKLFRRTFSFQNPIRQNDAHVKALRSTLDLPAQVFHSVIVFTGDCTFKTSMPENVTRGRGFISYIRTFSEPVLSESEVQKALADIMSTKLRPSRAVRRAHVAHAQARADSDQGRKCPRCGNNMVLRTARRGKHAGRRFWGCAGYPGCRMMAHAD